ncbi:MAG TPA: FHA domain-containing protein [Bryobacteraceae bacterium]|nr:FHA domain-containing protein [Bryobacteraceae bacterium]
MADGSAGAAPEKAWLVSKTGSQAGIRYSLSSGTTTIGRAPDNDVVLQGTEAGTVSLHHLTIERDTGRFLLRDLESTNGTFLNGERVTEVELHPPVSIRLGTQGPELSLVLEEPPAAAELDSTQVIAEVPAPAAADAPIPVGAAAAEVSGTYEGLLSDAVERARQARSSGVADQTMTIMRDALHQALRHTGRRFRVWIGALAAVLVGVSGLAGWKIHQLNAEKSAIDVRIQQIEAKLQRPDNPAEADRLVTELDSYEDQAQQLQQNLLYRVGPHAHDFVTDEIRTVMAEFGSEVYSVPPELTERVKHYIEQYQGKDRPLMERALGSSAPEFALVKQVLEQQHLPPDLAYVPLVESALGTSESSAGAAGLWQFTPATAKAYGLRVDGEVDERLDIRKSTLAACRYLRELILDFGSGSSVMLALAAYNLGPTKVKQAVMKTVQDPIKQRNFWYLYRTRSLPVETREYVPKVLAAIIIGRDARQLGF